MVLTAPLDLEYWLVTTFAGSADIFAFISFFVIAVLAGKFKMSNMNFAVIYCLYAFMIGFLVPWALLLAGVIGGLLIFGVISKIGNR